MREPSVNDIITFLYEVDKSFPTPLSQKQDLCELSQKLFDKATLCVEWQGEKICSMVAGYTENTVNNMAYISVVATLKGEQGKGYASRLMGEFIRIAEKNCLDAVHLYTHRENIAAINFYKKLGFVELVTADEPRPDDLHLIYYLENKRG